MNADEWIDDAAKRLQALEETAEDLREMLKKARKGKKRWKRKYLNLLVAYNELKMIHDDMCKAFGVERIIKKDYE